MRYVLFDLDGTLTDPGEGITNAVRYALEKFSIHPGSREELYPYIGPPLTDSFQRYHGLSAGDARQALSLYREYFSDRGIFENNPYPGVETMMQSLIDDGYTLMVATSKPEEFTHRILRHFSLDRYFAFVGGNTLDELRPTKAAVIAYIREQYPRIDGKNCLMVGDRRYDIEGAHQNGIPAIGVTYGYGTAEELVSAGADEMADDWPGLIAAVRRLMSA